MAEGATGPGVVVVVEGVVGRVMVPTACRGPTGTGAVGGALVGGGPSAGRRGGAGAVVVVVVVVDGVAVSIAWGPDPVPWETPVGLAVRTVPVLAVAEPSTVLNLNVPAVAPGALHGVRHAGLGSTGLIRAARRDAGGHPADAATLDRTGGVISLVLRGGDGADPDAERGELDPGSDAAALADGWATLTALAGIREDTGPAAAETLAKALVALEP